MRKLLYFVLGGMLLGLSFASCEDEPTNPGDFSIKGNLDVISIASALGQNYELTVSREFDSTIVRYNLAYDTIIAPDGSEKLEVRDTLWYTDGTCRYVKMKQIDVSAERDTITLEIVSNARWSAPAPDNASPRWYALQTNSGGGDGSLSIVTSRNGSSAARRNLQVQYIYTSDSAVIYEIPFLQVGRTTN